MAKRKMNENVKSLLMNDFLPIFIRYIKEKDIENLFYENDINKVVSRLKGVIDQTNTNDIKNFYDLIEMEIKWYEKGFNCCPSVFEFQKYNGFLTNKSKIHYCIGYFCEDIFGQHPTCQVSNMGEMVDELVEILIKVKK